MVPPTGYAVLRSSIKSLLILSYFSACLLVGAVIHLGTPLARTASAKILERYLGSVLEGKFKIGTVSELFAGDVSLNDIEVYDPSGRLVLSARHLSASVDLMDLAQRALAPFQQLSIEVKYVAATGVQTYLLPSAMLDENGDPEAYPSLVDAFASAPSAPSSKSKSERPLRIWFPKIVLHDASADGSIAGSPTMHTRVEQAVAKLLITEKGVLLDIDQFGLSAAGLLGADTTAQGELHVRVPGAISGKLTGTIGEVAVGSELRWEAGNLDLRGHFPNLRPTQVRPLVGSWPLDADIALSFRANGKMDKLALVADAMTLTKDGTHNSTIAATGAADLSASPRVQLKLVSRDLNLSHLIHALPTSQLTAESQIDIDLHPEASLFQSQTRLQAGTIDKAQLPPALVTLSYTADKLSAEVKIDDPQLKLTGQLTRKSQEPFIFSINIQQLSNQSRYIRAYSSDVNGSLSGQIKGQYNQDGTMRASADISTSELSWQELHIERARFQATASGDPSEISKLKLASELQASGVKFRKFEMRGVSLKQSGSIRAPHLDLSGTSGTGLVYGLKVDTDIEQRLASNLEAKLEGTSTPITLRVGRLKAKDGRFSATDLELTGLGELSGSLDIGAQDASIKLQARDVSLSRIRRQLGWAPGELDGVVDGDIDVQLSNQSTGNVSLKIREGGYKGFVNVSAELKTQIRGPKVTMTANAVVPGLAQLNSRLSTTIVGSLLEAANWQRSAGQLKTEVRELDLKTLSILLGFNQKVALSGQALVSIDIKRDSNELPQLTLTSQTEGLSATISRETDGPLVIEGIDIKHVITARAEDSKVETALRLLDSRGELASISGNIKLPLLKWWNGMPTLDELVATAYAAPLNAVAVITERKVSQFNPALELPLRSGRLNSRLAFSGSLAEPELGVVLEGKDLVSSAENGLTRPVSLRLNARYAAHDGSLSGNILIDTVQKNIGTLSAELNVPWHELTKNKFTTMPFWTGSTQLHLEDFPLELLQVATKYELQGRADGTVTVTRTKQMPEFSSQLRLRHLVAQGHKIGEATFDLDNRGFDFFGKAKLSDDYGTLEARMNFRLAELDGHLRLAPDHNVVIQLESDKYNAATAQPFLSGIVDEVSGSLSGQLQLELTPPQEKEPTHALLSGTMKMSAGTVRPSAVGLPMEDVELTLRAQREGKQNLIRLDNFRANVASNEPNLTGHAIARLNDLDPESGQFWLEANEIELAKGSAPLARVTASATGELRRQEGALLLTVEVSKLFAKLAEGVNDQLIDISENPHIEILQAPRRPEGETVSTRSAPLRIKVHLGNEVRVKHSLLDARLRGTPEILLGPETQISGGVELVRGSKFVVLGRTFVVDRGSIAFDTGAASDPHLQIGATWATPSQVIVRLDVGGTVNAPTLSWSSEPSLPGGEADILALVVGGGGGGGGGSSGGTSLALVANELSTVEGLAFYTTQQSAAGDGRVANLNDTTWENYTAAYQINDKLWFEGSVKSQKVSSAQSGTGLGISGTLDWRFLQQWSLRTEIGTTGLGLDMLWQYRY